MRTVCSVSIPSFWRQAKRGGAENTATTPAETAVTACRMLAKSTAMDGPPLLDIAPVVKGLGVRGTGAVPLIWDGGLGDAVDSLESPQHRASFWAAVSWLQFCTWACGELAAGSGLWAVIWPGLVPESVTATGRL